MQKWPILVYCNHEIFPHTRLLGDTRLAFSEFLAYTRLLGILVY